MLEALLFILLNLLILHQVSCRVNEDESAHHMSKKRETFLSPSYVRTADNSCQKYLFGRMYDCSKEGEIPELEASQPCKTYNPDNPTIIVADYQGRLGNQLWAYAVILVLKMKYKYEVYASRQCNDILDPYFKNLTLPIAEDYLCGLEETQLSYRRNTYESKVEEMINLTNHIAGYDVPLTKTNIGQLVIPSEVLKKHPELKRAINAMDYKDRGYNFTNSSYPWEIYKGSFYNLSNPKLKKGKAILLEDTYLDDSFFSPSVVDELIHALEQTFVFKDDLKQMASLSLDNINKRHRECKNTIKKDRGRQQKACPIKTKRVTGRGSKTSQRLSLESDGLFYGPSTIFVGIHSRRGDHISYERLRNDVIVDEDYFLEAMELYREKYEDVVFVYISDDLQWGKDRLTKRSMTRNMEIYFVGDHDKSILKDRNRDSIGHDLALMALCNHTILSRGTFSFWAGYFAGGSVVRPEHFARYRRHEANHNLFRRNPLEMPLPRVYKINTIKYLELDT